MNLFTAQLVAARVVAALASGDAYDAVAVLGGYDPDDRAEILEAARGQGAREDQIAAIEALLVGETIEVSSTAPKTALRWFQLAVAAVVGLASGMVVRAKVGR